jgi:hypothetical protein
MTLLALTGLDRAPFLALNNAHAVELSFATPERFDQLLARAAYARGSLQPLGFLLAFDEMAGIDSENYRWFADRHARFLYVDRIVVASEARRSGLARRLYQDCFEYARMAGQTIVGCEINADPPNPASDALHTGLGFETVGHATLVARGKSVRYVAKTLS